MRFCFVHAADLHLDAPFTGIGPLPAGLQAAVRDASLAAFDAAIDLAVEREAAFVLFSGDIWDDRSDSPRARLRFLQGLERLDARGIASVVVFGNRDPADSVSPPRPWPAGTRVVAGEAVGLVPIERDGVRLATIYGLSDQHPEPTQNHAPKFRRGPERGVHIAMVHCPVTPGAEQPAIPSVADLTARGMDYWALGHLHAPRILRERSPWIVYPGMHQQRRVVPEPAAHGGVMLVTVEDDRVLPPERVAVDRVRAITIEIDASGLLDLPALRAALIERGRALREAHAGRALIVRAAVRAVGPLARALRAPGVSDGLLRGLRDEARAGDLGLWWEAIRSVPPSSSEVLEGGAAGLLSVDLTRLAASLRAEPARLRAMLDGTPGPGFDDLAGDPADVLDDAALLALDLLERRQPA